MTLANFNSNWKPLILAKSHNKLSKLKNWAEIANKPAGLIAPYVFMN